jgi:hypothetical protein
VVTDDGRQRVAGDITRFYRTRRYVYTGLLVFTALVCLFIVAVPDLRDRLTTRIRTLRSAIAGESRPLVMQVGENTEPLPQEFTRPSPPPSPFGLAAPAPIRRTPEGVIILSPSDLPKSPEPVRSRVVTPPPLKKKESVDQPEPEEEAPASNEPQYKKGKIEQEAYDLLLQSNPAIAGMVNGNDPSLRFISWGATGRGEDTYWVRLKFLPQGKAEAEYIWQVRLESKEITPLNYNARSIH